MSSKPLFYTGCIEPESDKRDYLFCDLVSCTGAYPEEFIPDIDMKPFNQGTSLSCVACAVAAARYIYERYDSRNKKPFSPAYIYGNRCDGYTGEGMQVRSALKQLNKCGDCYYDSFPGYYDYSTAHKLYQKKRNAYDAEAKPFRTSSFYSVKMEHEIKKAILETGSVIASHFIDANWYNTGKNGIIPNYDPMKNAGCHAILYVGWKKINGKLYWIILNSWGAGWGDNGYGYLPVNYARLEAYCILDRIQEVYFSMLKDIENHWAKDSIIKAENKGAVMGDPDGSFRPNEPITRAEFVAVLDRLGLLE